MVEGWSWGLGGHAFYLGPLLKMLKLTCPTWLAAITWLSNGSFLTKRPELERVVLIGIRGPQLVDHGAHLGVQRKQNQPHVVGQIEHWLVALTTQSHHVEQKHNGAPEAPHLSEHFLGTVKHTSSSFSSSCCSSEVASKCPILYHR